MVVWPSHQSSAMTADLSAFSGHDPKIVLDNLKGCLCAILVRAPSIYGHFDVLAN